MRQFLAKLAVVVVAVVGAGPLAAQQVHSIVSGRTTLQLNQQFVQTIASYGASFSDLGLAALQTGTVSFPIANGAVDLNTVAGELRHKGGLIISANGDQIELRDWVLDITGPQPTISALFVINGALTGRLPLFLVQPPVDLALPLQPQGGVIAIKQASLFLSAAGASTFNSLFGLDGSEQLQTYTPVGNIDVYAVLASATIGTV